MEKKFGMILLFVGVVIIAGWLILSHQPQISKKFGIYLLEENKLVISDKDIVWYNKTSHEIKLTKEGVEKIEALQVPLNGKPFVVRIDGKEIYNGTFVTPISSIPCRGIVIVTLVQDGIIKMERGYPPSEFEGVDPRINSEIFDCLQKDGKLIQ